MFSKWSLKSLTPAVSEKGHRRDVKIFASRCLRDDLASKLLSLKDKIIENYAKLKMPNRLSDLLALTSHWFVLKPSIILY